MTQSSEEEKLQRQLQAEGFRRTCVWEDAPNAFYAEHTHPTETAHIILDWRDDARHSGQTADLSSRRALRRPRWCCAFGSHGTKGLSLSNRGAL